MFTCNLPSQKKKYSTRSLFDPIDVAMVADRLTCSSPRDKGSFLTNTRVQSIKVSESAQWNPDTKSFQTAQRNHGLQLAVITFISIDPGTILLTGNWVH